MTRDLIRYDILAQNALRGVVREALDLVKAHGLLGEHHFYISFRTDVPGVRMSPRLRQLYPKDMMIVIQHQFRNLTVAESHFGVGLSFNGIPEDLVIPFAAVEGFFDPSVQFGLQFEALDEYRFDALPMTSMAVSDPPSGRLEDGAEEETVSHENAYESREDANEGANILKLDSFRKKN